jgi:hypothetical protein
MVVSPDKGARIIESHERLINDSLMQLVCRPVHTFTPSRDSLINALEEIADLRFGSEPSYPRPAGYYSGPLYWQVFSADPLGNVQYRLERLRQRHHNIWMSCDCERMYRALRQFHTDYANGCQEQQMSRMDIVNLIDQFINTMTAETLIA